MDGRDFLNNLACALRSEEGRQLVASALAQATTHQERLICELTPGTQRPGWTLDGRELRVDALYSTHVWSDDESQTRKLLCDFESIPPTASRYGHIHHNNRHDGRQEWMIYPNEAVVVGLGLQFRTSLHQAFTPSIDVTSKLRSVYYAHCFGLPEAQAGVLVVNSSDDIVNVHKGQLMGHMAFHSAVAPPRIEYIELRR